MAFAFELRFIERSRPAKELPAEIVWVAAGGGAEPGHFVEPIGLVAHPSGDIYVADLENARVQRLSAEGAFLSLWPATDGASPSLGQPSDVAVGGGGEVYALDAAGFIYRLEPDGTLAVAVPLTSLQPYAPRGLAVDDVRGRFYVADTGQGRVLVLGKDGSLIDTWGPGGDDDLGFEEPWGLSLDSEGNVFVAERANSRIRKMSPDGAIVAEWTIKGAVSDLAVGPDDGVYIGAADRARLLVYDGQGKVLGQVTSPLQAASQPPGRGLAVVASGDVVMGTEGPIVRVSVELPP